MGRNVTVHIRVGDKWEELGEVYVPLRTLEAIQQYGEMDANLLAVISSVQEAIKEEVKDVETD